jgi:two-component system OmpR family sensor kinase
LRRGGALRSVQAPGVVEGTSATWGRLAVEAAQVLALTALAGVALGSLAPRQSMSTMQWLAFLAPTTAAPATVVALLSVVVPRMSGDRQLRAVGWAWGFYGVVVLPMGSVTEAGTAPHLWAATSAAATAVFLTWFALITWPLPFRWPRGVRLCVSGLLSAGFAVLAALRTSVATLGDVQVDSAGALFSLGWALLAYRCIRHGIRRGKPVWWRTGIGLGVIAAGQLLAALQGASGGSVLQFPALRLLGFLVIAVALVRYSREVVRDRRDREAERDERVARAEHAEAQRSHEIRTALSNLSAITTLLAPGENNPPRTANHSTAPGTLDEIITSEFARLHSLLENSSSAHDSAGTPVDRVLTRLVTLRRLTGSSITLSCPPGLVTAAPAATLAQVVTNLLANCARHAPGAEIHVSARTTPGACVIEVTDAGPGLRALQGETATTGSGLGLELSSQLVQEFGGTLQLMPATRFPTGTTARLCLPLVGDGRGDHGYDPRSADLQRVS